MDRNHSHFTESFDARLAGAQRLHQQTRLEEAQEYARASVSEPAAFLRFTDVFGPRLAADPRFASAFTESLISIREEGTYRTLEQWLDGGG